MKAKITLALITSLMVLGQGETASSSISTAAPFMPAVNTDMNCPSISGGWPDVFGTIDGTTWSCFSVPLTPNQNLVVGTPNTRSLSVNTAYQATDTTKAAYVVINVSSSASITLTNGTTNTYTVVIGATSAVASGTGTTIETATNGNTGTLTIGLALTQTVGQPLPIMLPAGWYFAIRPTAGSITIASAFDQSLT